MASAAVSEIIEFLSELARDQNMRVTITQSARGGLMAGGGALVGGLVGGPIGIFVGGSVGALVGSASSSDFKPVAQIIMEMPSHQQVHLAGRVREILQNRDVQTLAVMAVTTGAATAVREEVVKELQRYVTKELCLTMA